MLKCCSWLTEDRMVQMHGAAASSRRGWRLLFSSTQSCGASLSPIVPACLPACLPSLDISHTCSLPPSLHFSLASADLSSFPGRSRCVSTRSKMLACTEMITMCLQSAKQKHLRAQQQQQQQPLHSAGQGLTIFHDVSGSTLMLLTFKVLLLLVRSVFSISTLNVCFLIKRYHNGYY